MLLSIHPAAAQTTIVDYDADDDRLIEIRNLAQLDAIRHDLNGNGDASHADYIAAFPNRDTNANTLMGCPAGEACQGYELAADLDFDSDGDGDIDAADHSGAYHNSGAGWTPIGTSADPFTATFHGNGHTISSLFINRPSVSRVGLFGQLSGAALRNVGLVKVNITGQNRVGALAGGTANSVSIANSYAAGPVSGDNYVGGLTGYLDGTITASYAAVPVAGSGSYSGGLVGQLWSGAITAGYATAAVSGNLVVGGLAGGITASGTVTASYAAGPVSGSDATGGLMGRNDSGTVTDSYYDRERTGQSDNTGKGEPKTTAQLQEPAGYEGIYANWNVDLDGDPSTDDDPWDFGSDRNYPLLRVDFDGDGTATCEEFGNQGCYRASGPPAYHPAHDHPESYYNPRYFMVASCEVGFTWTDAGVTTATLNFHLGLYTRPVTLTLSLWDGEVFRTLQSQGLPTPQLQRQGRIATVQLNTDPSQTRFRLDSEYGMNLVLGYADCSTDDPEE